VPSGVFASGSLQLKSRVTLKVGKDAILRGSPNIADYTVETAPLHWSAFGKFAASNWKQCLIYAENAQEIGIEGPGAIDGQGGTERRVFPNANDPRRPMLVRIVGCRKVTVREVNRLDPASFTTFFVRCEDIHIERVTIRSRKSPNGDGLNFNGCRRVRIKDCDLDTGDDGIGPKTFHPDWPNEDFEISGCRITSRWHAIRVGAESIGAIRRLTMRDCVFTQCQGGIKIESSEGAQFEELSFSSRYVGTSANGWREWGLIDPEGKPSGTSHALRREHSGFVVRSATLAAGALTVRIEPRADFPIFPTADCELRVNFRDGQTRPLDVAKVPLRTDAAMKISAPAGASGFRLEIWRAGFRTAAWSSVNLGQRSAGTSAAPLVP
jgi:hypothetical protein